MPTANNKRPVGTTRANTTGIGNNPGSWANHEYFKKPLDIYNAINVHQVRDVSYSPSSPGRWYIFVVKPSCNITPKTINSSRFLYYLSQYKHDVTTGGDFLGNYILSQLSYGGQNRFDAKNAHSPVIELLTNTAREFTPNNTTIDTMNYAETPHGNRHVYAKHDVNSTGANTLSISYNELEGEPILNLHKAWAEYILLQREGSMAGNPNFLSKKILDYPSAIFYFLVGADGYSLQYWAKYTGVFPIEIPYSSFRGGPDMSFPTVDIQYQYIKKEDMDPAILDDFNFLYGVARTPRKRFPKHFLEKMKEWVTGNSQANEQKQRNIQLRQQHVEMKAEFAKMSVQEYLAKNPDAARIYTGGGGGNRVYVNPSPDNVENAAVNFRSVNIRDLQDYDMDQDYLESSRPEIVNLYGTQSHSSRLGLIFK